MNSVDLWSSLFDLNLLSENQQQKFGFYTTTYAFEINLYFHRPADLLEEDKEEVYDIDDIDSTPSDRSEFEAWSQHKSDDEFDEDDFLNFVRNIVQICMMQYGGMVVGFRYTYALNIKKSDTETFDHVSSDTFDEMMNMKSFNAYERFAAYKQFQVE